MSNKVIATIDISRPAGRKLVRELQNQRTVTLEYPLPEEITNQEWQDVKTVFKRIEKDLNEHYGTNHKLKYR